MALLPDLTTQTLYEKTHLTAFDIFPYICCLRFYSIYLSETPFIL
jgi:hypothetical protein